MTEAHPTDEVRLEIDQYVARVTIDRPQVLNAIGTRTLQQLNETWERIEADPKIRVVVLTGEGDRAFCTGADMSAKEVNRTGLEYWAALDPNGFGGLSLRTTLDVPVIARVNGYALGGGMEMVLGCDIVVAADHAQFGLTEPRVGRVPLDGGVTQLLRRIPHAHAMSLLLTGRRASATELAGMGLVNEVVPTEHLDEAVNRWIADILACAPTSLRAIKQMMQRTAHLTSQEARATQVPALMAALDSEDSREGIRAFQQKRPPNWPGH